MKRFVYRLDSVLRIRRFEFDRARQDWLTVEAERRRIAERVSSLSRRLDRGRTLLDRELRMGAASDRLALRAAANAAGRYDLERTQAELEALLPVWEEKRDGLRQAGVRVRSLERLRDGKERQHREASQRFEQKELDEIAMLRLARTNAGNEEAAR